VTSLSVEHFVMVAVLSLFCVCKWGIGSQNYILLFRLMVEQNFWC